VTLPRAGRYAIRIPTAVGGDPLVRNVQMGCGVHTTFHLLGVREPIRGKAAEI